MVSALYETLLGIVENVIVPAVLNTILSPATGAVPPQFEAVVQFLPVPVPPAQVLVADAAICALVSSTMSAIATGEILTIVFIFPSPFGRL
jgi:hypothetical protein